MKKFAVNLLCVFIPFRQLRRRVRKHFLYIDAYQINETNQIIIDGKPYKKRIDGFIIEIFGDNNSIIFDSMPKIATNNRIAIQANNIRMHFGRNLTLRDMAIHAMYGNNQKFSIGDNTVMYGDAIRLNEDDAEMRIGKNCLFSNQLNVWAYDGHSVIDINTGKLINRCINKPLVIGDNVWCGNAVMLLKSANVPDNTIIGGGSVVSKKFTEQNTVIAGNPARVIKQNVRWHPRGPGLYERIGEKGWKY